MTEKLKILLDPCEISWKDLGLSVALASDKELKDFLDGFCLGVDTEIKQPDWPIQIRNIHKTWDQNEKKKQIANYLKQLK